MMYELAFGLARTLFFRPCLAQTQSSMNIGRLPPILWHKRRAINIARVPHLVWHKHMQPES